MFSEMNQNHAPPQIHLDFIYASICFSDLILIDTAWLLPAKM